MFTLNSEILIDAKRRISSVSDWTTGTAKEEVRSWLGRRKYRWCSLGSVAETCRESVSIHVPVMPALDLLDRAASILFKKSCIVRVNDDMGHKEALQCFDWAIAEALRLESLPIASGEMPVQEPVAIKANEPTYS